MENARLLTEQREALEQQTATSDVLQVINSSLGDLAPVFDAILEKAHRLCGVTHGGLVLRDGETFRAVATHSYSGAFEEQLRQGYRGADNPITRSLIDGARFVHLPDLAQIDHPMVRASFELEGVRTGLYVPLRKDDVLLGMISSTRTEIRPFSDKEIALVENFAAQAVIAMENARLLGELRQRTGDLQESLEYQTAISDVLKVISRSTFDLQPVLETLLGTAARLCDADGGGISLREGNGYRMAASYYSATSEYDAFFRNRLMTVDRGSVTGRTVLEARIIHVTDIMSDPEFTLPAVQLGGARTVLGVPLLRDGVVVGVMILLRKPVLPFTDRQIELVATFADQAVIAIENVRLVTEQQDALDQQTATAEVLGVINASPGDLAPVFDAMLEKATRLCEADFGILWNFDGELAQAGALHRVPTAYAEMVRAPFRPSPESGPARMMRGEGTFVVADLLELPAYHAGDALVRAIVDLAGARSVVISPLRKDAVTLGAITIYRQEVRPFTEKQIALLENFAAQAVIAMENARLIDEIRTARDDAEATLRELKTAQANLIQAEKMASLGQLTAGIAHEIKNPLNFINNFSDLSVELLGELKETAAPGFAAAGCGSARRNRRSGRDAYQQSGKDHRARATRRRHRPRHAGTFARRVRRAAGGRDQHSGRRDTEPRLPRRARPGSEFQYHAGTGFRRRNSAGRGEPAGPDKGVFEHLQQRLLCGHEAGAQWRRRRVRTDAERHHPRCRRGRGNPRAGQRHRHSCRHQGQTVPAVLHHQADRRRHWPGSVDHLRHRHAAAWRQHRRGQQGGRIQRVHDTAATQPVGGWWHPSWRAEARHPCLC